MFDRRELQKIVKAKIRIIYERNGVRSFGSTFCVKGGKNNITMPKIKEHQISLLIKEAAKNLTYCVNIYDTLKKNEHFDPQEKIDNFYSKIINMTFNESLLVIDSLLSKDRRVISLWNFINQPKILKSLNSYYLKTGLKKYRNQLLAHKDINNDENFIPDKNSEGLINLTYIKKLQTILNFIEDIFRITAKNKYSKDYFLCKEEQKIIKYILEKMPPQKTTWPII